MSKIIQNGTLGIVPDDPINSQQASSYLNLSISSLYQNIEHIPHRKRNGKLYFFKSELGKYIDEGFI
ncbi:hypothetical protein GCM10028809_29420 [Spirosoma gilvum]